MKKLYLILSFLLCVVYSYAQFPISQQMGSPVTQVFSRGGFGADSGFIFRNNYADSNAANEGFIKNIPGIVVRINDTLFKRNNSVTRWEKLAGNDVYNIYTTDSTIYDADGVRRAQLLNQTKIFWRQGEYEPPESTNIPIFSFGTKDTILNNSYFSAQRKSFEFERVVRFISHPFREYLGGASMGMVIEANDTARIGTVGGDFGYGLRGATQYRKPTGFSGKTAILSGGYPLDAQPVILSDYLMTGSTSSSNYFKNRGWVSGVTSYFNATQFDSAGNYIGFLVSKVNTAKIETTYGFYDNISGFSGIDSSKSIWSPSGVAHSWIGGKLQVGGGGAWTQIPLGGINSDGVQFQVHGNVKVDTGYTRIYGSWNTPEDSLFIVAKGGKPLLSVDAVTSYVTASDGIIAATGFVADGTATRIRNNAFLQFSTGSYVQTYQQPLFSYRSYPLVNENDLRGFVFGNDTSGTALAANIADTVNYKHIQVNTKSPIDSATREVFHVSWTGKVLARDLPYEATVDSLVGWKDGYLVSTLSSQFSGGGGGITDLNTLTATTQTFATGTTGSDFNIASATSTHTFNIPDAGAAARGVVTTGTQTFAGDKTFSSAPTFSTMTATRVPFFGTAGLLSDDAGMTYASATDRLTVAGSFDMPSSTTEGLRRAGTVILYDNGSQGRWSPGGGAAQVYTAGSGGSLSIFNSGGSNSVVVDGQGGQIYRSSGLLQIQTSANLSVGSGAATTGRFNLPAGTTSAPPIRFTSGPLTTAGNILAGNFEFLTDKFYGTITTGPAAHEFTMNEAALTPTRIPIATTNGRLTDNANLNFSTGLGVGLTGSGAFAIGMGGTGYTSGAIATVGVSLSPAASADANIAYFGGTIVEAGSGTHAYLGSLNLDPPTITVGAATVTNAYTLRVSGAPSGTFTNPALAFWVDDGTAAFDAGVIMSGVGGAGALTIDGSGNVSSTSDRRMKFIDKNYNVGLKEVLQLNPIVYRWRPESGMETHNQYAGFDALQVYDVMGEMAAPTGKNGYHSLQDRAIMAALVNSIKEQQRQIEELKNIIIKMGE